MKNLMPLSLFLICSCIASHGQRKCPDCADALNARASDEFLSKNSYKYDEATSELFSHDYDYWSNYQISSNTAANAALSIFSASFKTGSNETRQKFESMRDNHLKNRSISTDEQAFLSQKVASPTAYAAWTSCILACEKGRSGGDVFLETSPNNNDEFIVLLKYVPRGGPGVATIVTNVGVTNATFVSGDLKQNNVLNPWNTLQGVYKRTDRGIDIVISITLKDLPSPDQIIIPKFQASDAVVNRAASSFDMPAGTVVAYAGNSIPPGWLLCDGKPVNEKDYQALSYAIGTYWGNGDGTRGSFNLPDMRGMFLRGVDGGSGNDPDAASRTTINTNKAVVGSSQQDAFQGHGHQIMADDRGGSSKGLDSNMIRYTSATFTADNAQATTPIIHG